STASTSSPRCWTTSRGPGAAAAAAEQSAMHASAIANLGLRLIGVVEGVIGLPGGSGLVAQERLAALQIRAPDGAVEIERRLAGPLHVLEHERARVDGVEDARPDRHGGVEEIPRPHDRPLDPHT